MKGEAMVMMLVAALMTSRGSSSPPEDDADIPHPLTAPAASAARASSSSG